jgi:tetratricopeptide (TPR) repeat protein
MDIESCFKILELDSEASVAEINSAYKDLVSVWHPDRFAANPRLRKKAEGKLKEINLAHEQILAFLSEKPTSFDSNSQNTSITPSDMADNSPSDAPRQTGPGQGSESLSGIKATAVPQPRPGLRFFSRTIDYLLFGLLLKITGFAEIIILNDLSVFIVPVLLVFAWIIPETLFLSLCGFTPGKWLLRISVTDKFQLRPSFSGVLRRSLSVWCNGMGMGVPFITPFTAALARHRLKTTGGAQWDVDGGFSVGHGEVSALRMSIALLFSIICIASLSFDAGGIITKRRIQSEQISPDIIKNHLKLGASYEKRQLHEKAIQAYKEAVRRNPNDAVAYYNLGSSYLGLRKYHEAIEAFKNVIKLKPGEVQAHYHLGLCYWELRLPEEAIQYFQKVLESKADSYLTYFYLGLSHQDVGQHREAISALEKAISLRPDDAEAFYALGVSYTKTQYPEKAIAHLLKAIQLKPDHSRAYHVLGLTYLSQGEKSAAIEQYEHLRNLDKSLADELLRYIEKMK